MANFIINKGIHAKVRVHGDGLVVGQSYTAVLYSSVKNKESRAEQTMEAVDENGVPTCLFDFTPEQTLSLKVGNLVLEVYDPITLQQMKYDESFATVRATSLSE